MRSDRKQKTIKKTVSCPELDVQVNQTSHATRIVNTQDTFQLGPAVFSNPLEHQLQWQHSALHPRAPSGTDYEHRSHQEKISFWTWSVSTWPSPQPHVEASQDNKPMPTSPFTEPPIIVFKKSDSQPIPARIFSTCLQKALKIRVPTTRRSLGVTKVISKK